MFLRPKFIYRKHLAPHIWGDDKHMRSDVRVAILTVIDRILQEIKSTSIPFDKSDIRDIFVHGSITNYYYNKNSDIDVCVVCDCSRISHSMPDTDVTLLLKVFAKSVKFNYTPRVCGRSLDIEFVNVQHPKYGYGRYKVGGAYSLLTSRWIHENIRLTKSELKHMCHEAQLIYRDIVANVIRLLHENVSADYIESRLNTLQDERRTEYDTNYIQPLNPKLIAFRMVRSSGLINRAWEHALKLRAAGKK